MWPSDHRSLQLAQLTVEEGGMLLQEGAYHKQPHRRTSILHCTALASAVALGAVGVCLCFMHRADGNRGLPNTASVELDALPDDESCHTAKPGDKCHTDVMWAMTQGIVGHPDWYSKGCPDLSPSSSFNEFQTCVHKLNSKSCPSLPCKSASKEEQPQRPKPQPIHMTPPEPQPQLQLLGQLEALEKQEKQQQQQQPKPQPKPQPQHQQPKAPSQGGCTTPSEGSKCYKHVEWALHGGIRKHPFWYMGLSEESTFEEVQEYLHKKSLCPAPCADGLKLGAEKRVLEVGKECRTVQAGEICYKNVLYGMRRGLFEHPEWYPGLDEFSSFEEFQSVLHSIPDLQCPKPCACSTAKYEDGCYKNVKWVLREGIKEHPEWYPNVNESSRWEVVQDLVHRDHPTKCDKPCSPKVWGTPSLFCFAVFRSSGYELDLVKSQVERGLGIFSCDEFAVLSDQELAVTNAIKTLHIPPCEKTGVSKDGTAANTEIFMNAWTVVHTDMRYRAHDWVIKADPDAVVIVDRLRTHLAPHNHQNVFIQNCMKYEGPDWPTMFGSLEAFSHQAIEAYFAGKERCKAELDWQKWGEDLFMNNCLKLLGAKPAFDGQLISDNVCKGASCEDGISASYHPFKSSEEWLQCYSQATGTALFKK